MSWTLLRCLINLWPGSTDYFVNRWLEPFSLDLPALGCYCRELSANRHKSVLGDAK